MYLIRQSSFMIKTTNESSICLTCDKDIYKKHYNDTEIKTHKQT